MDFFMTFLHMCIVHFGLVHPNYLPLSPILPKPLSPQVLLSLQVQQTQSKHLPVASGCDCATK